MLAIFKNRDRHPNCILKKGFGFDLWKSRDGIHWLPVTINGLCNPYNYGARTIMSSQNGNLYLGTANPFQGCEVWVKRGRHC